MYSAHIVGAPGAYIALHVCSTSRQSGQKVAIWSGVLARPSVRSFSSIHFQPSANRIRIMSPPGRLAFPVRSFGFRTLNLTNPNPKPSY